jgi:hypothetical protein
MELPKLPGYVFYDPRKTDYRKGQFLHHVTGRMMPRSPRREDLEESAGLATQSIRFAPDGRPSACVAPPRDPVSTFPDYIPPHVAYEHLVLRFYAYFRESVPESNDETHRVRYVKIHVYLEDDSVMIEENIVRNAGIPQGVILRRMKVLNPNIQPLGAFYKISDFNVGQSMDLSGIVYRLYACDAFTEEYFRSNGVTLNKFETPPDDLYTIKRRLTDRPIRVTYINTDKTNLRRFLDFDGKVLRFYTTWDDRKAIFGEKRNFILHFFLVDGTIEIRQVLPLNSGRDPVSQFLKRTRLKKPGTDQLYLDSDLEIGKEVDVFGRKFLLYDADGFTKQFLDEKYGQHDWTPIDVDQWAATKKAERPPPPYNGWGDEADSLGFCYSLHPKPPRKDIIKLITKDGYVLRFAAKFKNPQPQDVRRTFVIVYYLADDTVAVFELQHRNSGFRGGKFIQRGKWKNVAAGGRGFIAADFKVGEEITINCFTFITSVADDFAMNFMESQSDNFTQSDLVDIITACKKEQPRVQAIREAFEAIDPDLSGWIHPSQAEEALKTVYGQQFNLHQIRTIVRRWTEQPGFDYFSFMSALA